MSYDPSSGYDPSQGTEGESPEDAEAAAAAAAYYSSPEYYQAYYAYTAAAQQSPFEPDGMTDSSASPSAGTTDAASVSAVAGQYYDSSSVSHSVPDPATATYGPSYTESAPPPDSNADHLLDLAAPPPPGRIPPSEPDPGPEAPQLQPQITPSVTAGGLGLSSYVPLPKLDLDYELPPDDDNVGGVGGNAPPIDPATLHVADDDGHLIVEEPEEILPFFESVDSPGTSAILTFDELSDLLPLDHLVSFVALEVLVVLECCSVRWRRFVGEELRKRRKRSIHGGRGPDVVVGGLGRDRTVVGDKRAGGIGLVRLVGIVEGRGFRFGDRDGEEEMLSETAAGTTATQDGDCMNGAGGEQQQQQQPRLERRYSFLKAKRKQSSGGGSGSVSGSSSPSSSGSMMSMGSSHHHHHSHRRTVSCIPLATTATTGTATTGTTTSKRLSGSTTPSDLSITTTTTTTTTMGGVGVGGGHSSSTTPLASSSPSSASGSSPNTTTTNTNTPPVLPPPSRLDLFLKMRPCNHLLTRFLLHDKIFHPDAFSEILSNYACRNPSLTNIAKFLLRYRWCRPEILDNRAICAAAESGCCETVRLLLSHPRVDPTVWDSFPLRAAAENGHTDTVRLLLKDGRCDPAALDSRAFSLAAKNGHLEIMKILFVASGKNKKQGGKIRPDAWKNYAIRMAAENGHADVVQYLLERHGPDLNPCDENDYAIRMAVKNFHFDCVAALLMDRRVLPTRVDFLKDTTPLASALTVDLSKLRPRYQRRHELRSVLVRAARHASQREKLYAQFMPVRFAKEMSLGFGSGSVGTALGPNARKVEAAAAMLEMLAMMKGGRGETDLPAELVLKRVFRSPQTLKVTELLMRSTHPGLLRCYGAWRMERDPRASSKHVCLLVETSGDMRSWETVLEQTMEATDPLVDMHMVVQMADALAFLHQNGVFHGNLSPGNVLLQWYEKETGKELSWLEIEDARSKNLAVSAADAAKQKEEEEGEGGKEEETEGEGEVATSSPTTRLHQHPHSSGVPEADLWRLRVILDDMRHATEFPLPLGGASRTALGLVPPELIGEEENDQIMNTVDLGAVDTYCFSIMAYSLLFRKNPDELFFEVAVSELRRKFINQPEMFPTAFHQFIKQTQARPLFPGRFPLHMLLRFRESYVEQARTLFAKFARDLRNHPAASKKPLSRKQIKTEAASLRSQLLKFGAERLLRQVQEKAADLLRKKRRGLFGRGSSGGDLSDEQCRQFEEECCLMIGRHFDESLADRIRHDWLKCSEDLKNFSMNGCRHLLAQLRRLLGPLNPTVWKTVQSHWNQLLTMKKVFVRLPMEFWLLLESCWATDPSQRPSMAVVASQLRTLLVSRRRRIEQEKEGLFYEKAHIATDEELLNENIERFDEEEVQQKVLIEESSEQLPVLSAELEKVEARIQELRRLLQIAKSERFQRRQAIEMAESESRVGQNRLVAIGKGRGGVVDERVRLERETKSAEDRIHVVQRLLTLLS